MKEYICELREKAANLLQTACDLESLLEKYPDLMCQRRRGDLVSFHSSLVNQNAKSVHICHDEDYIYITSGQDEGNLYVRSQPERCYIGRRYCCHDISLKHDWEQLVRQDGYPDGVLEQIRCFAEGNIDDY